MAYALPTRSAAEDPIFGHYLEQLPQNKLPLMTEIYRNFLFRRETEFQQIYVRNGKIVKSLDEAGTNRIVNDLVESLKQIWVTKASIPVRDDLHIFTAIKNIVNKAKTFGKDSTRITSKLETQEDYLKRKGFDQILDISKCR